MIVKYLRFAVLWSAFRRSHVEYFTPNPELRTEQSMSHVVLGPILFAISSGLDFS